MSDRPTTDVPAPGEQMPDKPPVRERREDKTALSFWFPQLLAADLPVPRTKTFKMPKEAQEVISGGFDGKDGDGTALREFARHLAAEVADLGSPFFLRTDHTSGKHDWSRTCFVANPDKLTHHLFAIAEFSEICGGFGDMPWDTWVARELLPTEPFGVCPRYGDMPICREFRFFVDGAAIKCFHPYWPRHALEKGGARLSDAEYDKLCALSRDEEAELSLLAAAVGDYVGGAWSVDILATKRGWYVTDMAEAHKSFHWEGCANEEAFR